MCYYYSHNVPSEKHNVHPWCTTASAKLLDFVFTYNKATGNE